MKPDPLNQVVHFILDELSYLPESERIPGKFIARVLKLLIEKNLPEVNSLHYQQGHVLRDIMWILMGDNLVTITRDSAGGFIFALGSTTLNRS
jgi:hypothetical protein